MLRTIITSVGFGDFLSLTLPWNRHHWQEVMVLTSPADSESATVARANGASVYATNAFYTGGAKFNKYLAIEECLDHFGRHGVICLVDVDIFWPKILPPFSRWRRGNIYSFRRRRLLVDVTAPIPPENEWHKLPMQLLTDKCFGFTQIFWADDPVLGKPPWHPVDITHAGLGDNLFQNKWPSHARVWLERDVLHLGDHGNNWLGRVVSDRNGRVPDNAGQLLEEVRNVQRSITWWG